MNNRGWFRPVRPVAAALGMVVCLSALACADAGLPVYNPFDVVDPGTPGDPGTPEDPGRTDPGRDPGTPPDPGPGEDPGTPFDPGPGVDPGTGEDPGTPPDPGKDPGTPPTDNGTDPGPGCLDSSTCPLGSVCVDRACLPGCNSDRDCPSNRHCKPDSLPHGACLQCLEESHCSDAETCVAGNCVFTCRTANDCKASTATPQCDTNTGLCVACLSDGQCPIGNLCVANACKPGCRSDRDCNDGLKCDPTFAPNGGCFACIQDADCGVKVCRSHACVIDCSAVKCTTDRPVCDPATGGCVQCLQKSDCPAGNLCMGQACRPGCETDGDCKNGLHCGNGSCVECTADGQCPLGQKCRSYTCSTSECYKDTDCANGEYCHPLLYSCEKLPGKPCTSANDCTSIFPGLGDEFCDPLTRECIPGCILGGLACLDLLGSGRNICVDGGCYGCGSDSDCAGVRCDPFDRWCRACGSDADCALPGWHCATDGACYECLSDGQCTFPQVCDEAGGNRCVDCLTNADCKTPGKPVCGKSKACIPPCTNECTTNQKICNPDDVTDPIGYLTCGDWDDDPCQEYGNATGCGTGASCVTQAGGQGKCVCQNECTSGQKRCMAGVTDTTETCTQNSSSGCWYWSTGYCGTGEVCSGGTCACSNACTVGQSQCESTSQVWKCDQDEFTYCPYWNLYNCNQGYACSSGACR